MEVQSSSKGPCIFLDSLTWRSLTINLRNQKSCIVNACPMCLADEEAMDHLFLNCRVAQFLWTSVFSWLDVSGVLPFSLFHLFEVWNLGVSSCRGRIMWRCSFVATLWVIWKERDNRCFQDKATNEILLRDKIKHLVASWAFPLASFRGFMMDMIWRKWKEMSCSSLAKLEVIHVWTPPPTCDRN